MEQPTVSPAQFARETGLSLQYIYSLLAAGRLAAEKRDGCWAIAAAELQKRQRREVQPA